MISKTIKDLIQKAIVLLSIETITEDKVLEATALIKQALEKAKQQQINKDLYIIELEKFNIFNDNTEAVKTTKGINNALTYAKEQGYKKVQLPVGIYSIDTSVISPLVLDDGTNKWTHNRKGIVMQSDLELIMTDATLQMIPTSDPYYSILTISGCENSRITGGTILGDKLTHDYGTSVNFEGNKFELGHINTNTGDLVSNNTSIRLIDFIDSITYKQKNGEIYNGDLPSVINIFPIINTTNNTTDGGKVVIYCYDKNNNFLGYIYKTYGTFNLLEGTKKIKIVLEYETRLDAVIGITGDVTYYNPEFASGIVIVDSENITIDNTKIYDCCGDCIQTFAPPIKISVNNLNIINCTLEGSRRQGISLTANTDGCLIKNTNIGKIQGTDPQSGIDIEHYGYVKNVIIDNCNFYDNKVFDIVFYNGNDIEVKNNTFNGGIGETYAYNIYVHDNNFIYKDNVDKRHKGWAYSCSNVKGYTKLEDNYFEGYSMGGVGVQNKKLEGSTFTRNKLVNCFTRLFNKTDNNIYINCEVEYVTAINIKNEKIIDSVFTGDKMDTTVTRLFENCYFENSILKNVYSELKETIFDKCDFLYNNSIFCDVYGGGKYTVKNSNIITQYTDNTIPFIKQQGCIATYINCIMNISCTQFVWANYNIFNMNNCQITFNQSYDSKDIIRVFSGNDFSNNKFYKKFDTTKVILPMSTNSTINDEFFTDSIII